jgi:diacylglycerol kinase (ATP)
MRAKLIINAISGNDAISNEEQARLVEGYLARGNLFVQAELTTPEREAAQIAREALQEGAELIIAGGGDGTIEPVASELVGTDAILGVLPMGTFNNFARSLDIPKDLEAACGVILGGYDRRIDVGRANGKHYYYEVAGVGLDAQLFPLGEQVKNGNWLRWLQIAAEAWRYRPQPITMSFDRPIGEAIPSALHKRYRKMLTFRKIRRNALMAVGANGPFYGGGLAVAPDARIEDGLLTVTVYRRFSKFELFRHFVSITEGRRQYSPKMESFQVGRVKFESDPPQAVHVDGRPIGNTPLVLECVPKALRVLCPERRGQPLPTTQTTAVKAQEGVLP